MPFPSKNPLSFTGTTVYSGLPNTGQSLWTQGGGVTVSVLSGTAGGHQLLFSGPGRLDAAFFHDSAMQALSGLPITFYDASAAVSGTFSGRPVLGQLAGGPNEGATPALSGALLKGGIVRTFGFPFLSGLAVTGASGMPGWSATYTPAISGLV